MRFTPPTGDTKAHSAPGAFANHAGAPLRLLVPLLVRGRFMPKISTRLKDSVASLALFTGALLAAPASAQQLALNQAGEIETVVVTGTAFNAEVAPAKSSLDTMEPQTIINKSYIQDSVANTSDYTTILAIAPSLTGMDIN